MNIDVHLPLNKAAVKRWDERRAASSRLTRRHDIGLQTPSHVDEMSTRSTLQSTVHVLQNHYCTGTYAKVLSCIKKPIWRSIQPSHSVCGRATPQHTRVNCLETATSRRGSMPQRHREHEASSDKKFCAQKSDITIILALFAIEKTCKSSKFANKLKKSLHLTSSRSVRRSRRVLENRFLPTVCLQH